MDLAFNNLQKLITPKTKHTHIYIHIYTYTHTYIYIYIYAHKHTHIYIYIYIYYIYIYIYLIKTLLEAKRLNFFFYIHTYLNIYIYIYTHTHIYIYIYIYILYIHIFFSCINDQVVHLKLQRQPDVSLFKKLLKDNRAQEICKNLRIYPSLQEEFVNFSMNCQILYIKTGKQPLL